VGKNSSQFKNEVEKTSAKRSWALRFAARRPSAEWKVFCLRYPGLTSGATVLTPLMGLERGIESVSAITKAGSSRLKPFGMTIGEKKWILSSTTNGEGEPAHIARKKCCGKSNL